VECLFNPYSDTALLKALSAARRVNRAIGTLIRAWATLTIRVAFSLINPRF
jgi:hypothetical protein